MKRRLFIKSATLVAAGISLKSYTSFIDELHAADTNIPKIKITEVRVHFIRQKLERPIGYCCSVTPFGMTHVGATIFEVKTDQGITGWGDGWNWQPIRNNPEIVIGRSPFEVEAIYEELGGYTRSEMEAGGLDIALWDIVGQTLGIPICRLFGKQYRTRVMPYASAGYRKDWSDPEKGFAEEERYWSHEMGYRAVKMKTGYGPEMDVRVIRAVREAIGPDIKLGIDSGTPGIYDDGTAVMLGRQLEDLNLEYWEEPIEKWDIEGYARLKNSLRIPLASGEALPIDWVIKNYINPQTIDIVQPDIANAGFTGARKVNYAAWVNRVRVMPHTWGTPIRIAATMHWAACIPQHSERFINPPPVLFELHLPHESPAWELTEKRIEVDKTDSMIEVPNNPGLGIKVIPEVLDKYRSSDTIIIS
ncbi:mandelate racemase/muconate lactonizing enzyme family protein [Candidatus Latescibacterota bacterium]